MSNIPTIEILPSKAWHESDDAQAILESIAANPPAYKTVKDFDRHNRGRRNFREYTGKRVAQLADIFAEFSDTNHSICDEAYEAAKREGASSDENYALVKHLYDRCGFLCSPRLQEVIASAVRAKVGEAA